MDSVLKYIRIVFDAILKNWIAILVSGSCVFVALLFLFLFYGYPVVSAGIEQPIAFSHRLHAGVKQIQCMFCHPNVKRSVHPGIPEVEKCLFCHKYIIANHPEILKEHEYFNSGTSTPWVKVNYIPEHVFFNHQRHIKKNIECRECHGEIETMDRVRGINFQMGFCLSCHREKKANTDCWLACHN